MNLFKMLIIIGISIILGLLVALGGHGYYKWKSLALPMSNQEIIQAANKCEQLDMIVKFKQQLNRPISFACESQDL